MNILVTLAFDGTCYSGFQVQQNALTICEVFQNAIEKLFGERYAVIGCSRTDSGVHASDYKVQFACEQDMPLRKLPLALNAHLPNDIRVTKAEEVPDGFHARYNAKSKKYTYYIHHSPTESPFFSKYCYRTGEKLDINAMQQATKHFIGEHDFTSFMSLHSDIKDTSRTIYMLQVLQKDDMILIEIEADGYLYNMVRIIAGTLLEVGRGRKMVEDIPQIIAARSRDFAGPTLPAKGLFLTKVTY